MDEKWRVGEILSNRCSSHQTLQYQNMSYLCHLHCNSLCRVIFQCHCHFLSITMARELASIKKQYNAINLNLHNLRQEKTNQSNSLHSNLTKVMHFKGQVLYYVNLPKFVSYVYGSVSLTEQKLVRQYSGGVKSFLPPMSFSGYKTLKNGWHLTLPHYIYNYPATHKNGCGLASSSCQLWICYTSFDGHQWICKTCNSAFTCGIVFSSTWMWM